MKKSTVLELLNLLEGDFKVEELIEKLLFVEKIEKAREDVPAGRIIELNEVKRRFLH